MEDQNIIALYFSRDQEALAETDKKYGKYCYAIAHHILKNNEDSKEAVNDTYMSAWNSIPPHRPAVLSAFLGKITRRISFKRLRSMRTQKRGNGEIPLVLDELVECLPADNNTELAIEEKHLTEVLNRFLSNLSVIERKVFVCRYFYLDSVHDISGRFCFSESKVKSMLFRVRKKLRSQLEKEGFSV